MTNTNIKQIFVTLLLSFGILTGCEKVQEKADTSELEAKQTIISKAPTDLAKVDAILSQLHHCNESIVIRSQALKQIQISDTCTMLIEREQHFHDVFGTKGSPVADDNNKTMRANVYHSRAEFVKYATDHFTMPTNNGGMYLEGYPDKANNQAEFVAYERDGEIWNLRHEFVHYLDGRFNRYGDYCSGLHDDHAGPEFCPSPNLAYPHAVWWGEGIGEYIAKGNDNPKAIALAVDKSFQLSELFNTSNNENTGGARVYSWGYLAVRFMMENHRSDIEKMLIHLRKGEWQGYQNIVRSWGQTFDPEFHQWLDKLVVLEIAENE